MDILYYRPLVIGLIELALMFLVLCKGKWHPRIVAAVLFFLAGYQLGEFMYFVTGSKLAVQFSMAATTMLPPLGMLFLERITKRGYAYLVWQSVGLIFALLFLLDSTIIQVVGVELCLLKVASSSNMNTVTTIWAAYYVGGLTLGMITSLLLYLRKHKQRRALFRLFLFYTSFFPISVVIRYVCNLEVSMLPSLMCALALVGAFIATDTSLRLKS